MTVAPTTNAAGRPTSIVAAAPTGNVQLTPAQAQQIIGGLLSSGGQVGSQTSALPGKAIGGIVGAIAPYLKIAVGALGLMVAGVTIVYVAGRKTGVGPAVAAVAGGPAGRVVSRATSGPRERRTALRTQVRATRRKVASEEARSRVQTRSTRSGGTRVRTISRREGAATRQQLAQAEAEHREHTAEQNRANLAALRERRSRAGTRTKVSA